MSWLNLWFNLAPEMFRALAPVVGFPTRPNIRTVVFFDELKLRCLFRQSSLLTALFPAELKSQSQTSTNIEHS